MLVRVLGIIIRSMDYGEGNKIVTVLTETHGKAGVLIRGASKAKSRHGSLALPFTYGEFVYFKGSGLGTLNGGEIVRAHHKLREHLDLAAYASYVCELTDRALQDEEAGKWIHTQLLACLDALEEGKDPAVTTHVYEMKILEAAGYTPVLDVCASCGRGEGPFALSPRLGGAVCPRCRPGDRYAIAITEGVLKLLRLFAAIDLRRLGTINVSDATKNAVKMCMRALVDTHLGLKLKSRGFLDSLDALNASAPVIPRRREAPPSGEAAEQNGGSAPDGES